jgi:hypothetical protein
MIADELATHIGSDATIAAEITGIRSIVKGLDDDYPYIVHETVNMRNIEWLSCASSLYEGVIRFSVVTLTQGEARDIAELVKDYMQANPTYAGDEYTIRRSRMEDEEDVAQALDGDEKPYFVKTLDYFVRAKKN